MPENRFIKKLELRTISQKEMSKRQSKIIKRLVFSFVINSPCDNQSYKGKKFKEYGLVGTQLAKLLKNIKEKLKKENVSFKYYCNLFENYQIEHMIKHYESKSYKQIIMFRGERNMQTKNLFNYLRNSFAHGNFILARDYIRMWNVSQKNNLNLYMYIRHENLDIIWNELINFTK